MRARCDGIRSTSEQIRGAAARASRRSRVRRPCTSAIRPASGQRPRGSRGSRGGDHREAGESQRVAVLDLTEADIDDASTNWKTRRSSSRGALTVGASAMSCCGSRRGVRATWRPAACTRESQTRWSSAAVTRRIGRGRRPLPTGRAVRRRGLGLSNRGAQARRRGTSPRPGHTSARHSTNWPASCRCRDVTELNAA